MKTIEDRVTELEQQVRDLDAGGKYGKRLHEFKNEIIQKLQETKERKGGIWTEQFAKDLTQGIQRVHHGVLASEHRMNLIWNTFNGFVRMVMKMATGDLPPPGIARGHEGTQPRRQSGIEPYWNSENFTQAMLDAGRECYEEAAALQKKELERMRAEKAQHGKVLSASSPSVLPGDVAMDDIANVIRKGVETNGHEYKEAHDLRVEAAQQAELDALRATKTTGPDGSVTIEIPVT